MRGVKRRRYPVKDGVAEIVNLQGDGGKAKRYQVKQVREIVARYDLKA
jgi:hypothetical protein